jgi:hypothetical protein
MRLQACRKWADLPFLKIATHVIIRAVSVVQRGQEGQDTRLAGGDAVQSKNDMRYVTPTGCCGSSLRSLVVAI